MAGPRMMLGTASLSGRRPCSISTDSTSAAKKSVPSWSVILTKLPNNWQGRVINAT